MQLIYGLEMMHGIYLSKYGNNHKMIFLCKYVSSIKILACGGNNIGTQKCNIQRAGLHAYTDITVQ